MIMRISKKVFIVCALCLTFLNCSGERRSGAMEDGLIDYDTSDIVTYSVSGVASCPACAQNGISIIGLDVEIASKDNLANPTGPWVFGGLGPFSIRNIKGIAGEKMVVSGILLMESSSGTASMSGRAEYTVPDDEGDTISVTLNFPGRAADTP